MINKSLILLGFIALSYANTCLFTGDAVETACTPGNTACIWNNTALWNNCSGTFPGSADTAIVYSNNNTFTLLISLPLNLTALIINGNGTAGTVSISADLMVGSIDVNFGTLFIDSDVMITANASIAVAAGSTINWSAGDITWAPMAAGTLSVEGLLTIGAGESSINQNIVCTAQSANITFQTTSSLSLNSGASIMVNNATVGLNGAVEITGTAGSTFTVGPIGMIYLAGTPATITLSVPTTIRSYLVLTSATLNINNAFFAGNFTVQNGSVVNVDITDNSSISFAATAFLNYGTVTWSAGNSFVITDNAQGSWVNYGLFTASVDNGTLSCFGSAMQNWDTLSVTGANNNIQGDFINKGTVVINGAAHFVGQNNTFSTVTLDGVTFTTNAGGSAIMKSNVNFLAGEYSLPSTILGTMSISGNDTKTLGVNVDAVTMAISTVLHLTVPFTNSKGYTIIGENGSFMPVDNDTAITFLNQGTVAGSLTFNLINVTNEATIGSTDIATVFTVVDSTLTLINTSNLIIGLSSQTTSPITISKTNSGLGAAGAHLNGNLLIVLLNSFNPQNGNMTLLKVNGSPTVNGNFTTFNVTEVENANTYECSYNSSALNYAPSTGEIFLNFENCKAIDDTSSGSGPSKTTIIIIVVVVVVVVVIAAIVGVVLYRRRNAAHHPSEKQRLI